MKLRRLKFMNDLNLTDIRQNYSQNELDEKDVDKDPINFFHRWMNEALSAKVHEPTAMSVSTVSKDGKPSNRILLLKAVFNGKFQFYTNYASRKSQDMENNANVCLLFFWPELERQVRIEGSVEKLSREESLSYFKSRPRESCIGAHASTQSSVIPSRAFIEEKYKKLEDDFKGIHEIPMPETWGGYQCSPTKIEFWQGRPSRLHDRILFTHLTKQEWKIERLSP